MFTELQNIEPLYSFSSIKASARVLSKGVFGGPSGPSREGPGVTQDSVGHKTDDKREEKKEKKWKKEREKNARNKREEIKKYSKTRAETEILTC